MAMFEFKDSKNIDLEDCKTPCETLMKGENVEGFVATNCEAGSAPDAAKPSPRSIWAKILAVIADHIGKIITGLIIVAIAGAMGLR
ncbi:hypothetical protein [Pseudomonas uvaldensis]|uniref:hypothetical protein n=1 Tax=Pseudomonas uvaldensis TaxID=2878385 RepID=UPI001E339090|nr:hypothetical protein [Pseudomonas uvaldensis]MCE0464890.1 hypothetical protein [Pseudomonas uvaldensis]